MGWSLTALVARAAVLAPPAAALRTTRPLPLRFGLAILPLPEPALAELNGPEPPPPLYLQLADLTPPVAAFAAAASALGPVAFLEADYAGGVGYQAAVLWRAGRIALGPLHGERPGPINQALAQLGVRPPDGCDEVDALGLDLESTSAAWLRP
jgi:hypothetical protein